MAKIHEEVVVIKLSKLVKEKGTDEQVLLATNDLCDALQSVVEELMGAGVVAEVERA
jgi:hypothetical protein